MGEEVVVSKRGVQRIRGGQVWVFRSDLEGEPDAVPGAIVRIVDRGRNPMGWGFYGSSQLALRVLTRTDDRPDRSFFRERLAAAIAKRTRLFPERDAVRLVHGEADGLPGLLVDKFGDAIVIQSLARAVDEREKMFIELLDELVTPRAIVIRDDGMTREYENMEDRKSLAKGDSAACSYHEGDLVFSADLLSDQKTGAFLDQYENHLWAASYARGKALDTFSYHGGFGLQLARYADSVVCVDQSELATSRIIANAKANGLANVTAVCANAFDYLREAEGTIMGAPSGRKERFDTIVIDPPAFAKRASALDGARRGYKELNLRGIHLLAPGGTLITCSCSAKVTREIFEEILIEAARDAKRRMTILERRGAGRDHPGLLGMPETEYLKCFVLQASD